MTDRQLIQWQNRHMGTNFPVPTKPRKLDNEESRNQSSLIDWWHHACAGLGVPEELFFAVGNGGFRTPQTGAILKREGVRRGTSDLILLAKRDPYGALLIEMKRPEGECSPEQRKFLKSASDAGYCSRVCYSTQQGMDLITRYLKGEENL